jgi:hypothetical protein
MNTRFKRWFNSAMRWSMLALRRAYNEEIDLACRMTELRIMGLPQVRDLSDSSQASDLTLRFTGFGARPVDQPPGPNAEWVRLISTHGVVIGKHGSIEFTSVCSLVLSQGCGFWIPTRILFQAGPCVEESIFSRQEIEEMIADLVSSSVAA